MLCYKISHIYQPKVYSFSFQFDTPTFYNCFIVFIFQSTHSKAFNLKPCIFIDRFQKLYISKIYFVIHLSTCRFVIISLLKNVRSYWKYFSLISISTLISYNFRCFLSYKVLYVCVMLLFKIFICLCKITLENKIL